MYVRNRREARIAARIFARVAPFLGLEAEDFYRRYIVNTVSPWSSNRYVHQALAEANAALRAARGSAFEAGDDAV